jgi:hypothetical protein
MTASCECLLVNGCACLLPCFDVLQRVPVQPWVGRLLQGPPQGLSLPHLFLSAPHVSVHSRAFFDKRLAQEVEGSALGEVSRSRQLLSCCCSHVINKHMAHARGAAALSAGSNRQPRQRRQQLTAPATSGWRVDTNSGAVTSDAPAEEESTAAMLST